MRLAELRLLKKKSSDSDQRWTRNGTFRELLDSVVFADDTLNRQYMFFGCPRAEGTRLMKVASGRAASSEKKIERIRPATAELRQCARVRVPTPSKNRTNLSRGLDPRRCDNATLACP